MNDMKFIETLKQKRKDCDYMQSVWEKTSIFRKSETNVL